MLNEVETERLRAFLKEVEKLKIRFPIAEISKNTEFDKGYVSKAIKGQKPLSDNFLAAFFDAYNISEDSRKHFRLLSLDPTLSGNQNQKLKDPHAEEDLTNKYIRSLEVNNHALITLTEKVARALDNINDMVGTIKSQQETIHNLSTGNSNGRASSV